MVEIVGTPLKRVPAPGIWMRGRASSTAGAASPKKNPASRGTFRLAVNGKYDRNRDLGNCKSYQCRGTLCLECNSVELSMHESIDCKGAGALGELAVRPVKGRVFAASVRSGLADFGDVEAVASRAGDSLHHPLFLVIRALFRDPRRLAGGLEPLVHALSPGGSRYKAGVTAGVRRPFRGRRAMSLYCVLNTVSLSLAPKPYLCVKGRGAS